MWLYAAPTLVFMGIGRFLWAVSTDKAWIVHLDHHIFGGTTGWQHRAIVSVHGPGSVCPN